MENEIQSWVGDLSQVAGVKYYELRSGRAKGIEALDIHTGAGLVFTVVENHALDTVWTSYKDITLFFITPNGVVTPVFSESQGNGFLRSSRAGLLTTYGLSYIGMPYEDEGETLGLHGRLTVVPTEEVGCRIERTDDSIGFAINGRVWEARLFGEDLMLKKAIRYHYGENVVRVEDEVTNHGFTRQSLQILCHFSYGQSLLSPQAEILLSVKSVTSRTLRATEGLVNHLEICTPQPGLDEQVYYLTLNSGSQGMSKVALVGAKLGWGIYEKFNIIQLPNSIRWKGLGAGEYIMGLEVSNSFPDGRDKERTQGRLPFIEPGEAKTYCFEPGIVGSDAEISTLGAEIASYHQLMTIKMPGSVNRPGVDYVPC